LSTPLRCAHDPDLRLAARALALPTPTRPAPQDHEIAILVNLADGSPAALTSPSTTASGLGSCLRRAATSQTSGAL
jgi:hypothetical protein